MKSIAEVQFRKGSSMLHYKKCFLEESYTTVIFLQSSFLKKDGLKTFPSPSTERRRITQSKPDNIVNTLKGVPQSAHSFLNGIYCNNTSSDLCCSRDILEEEECQTNCKSNCSLYLRPYYILLEVLENSSITYIIFIFHNIP